MDIMLFLWEKDSCFPCFSGFDASSLSAQGNLHNKIKGGYLSSMILVTTLYQKSYTGKRKNKKII